jgi:putative ABC transport system permease protein
MLSRFLEGLLFEVTPLDALTFAGTALILVFVALAASWLPAHRATTVDPNIALRAQ